MTGPRITDAEIVARYQKGDSIRSIPAGDDRIRYVLREAGVPIRRGGSAPDPMIARRNAAIAEGYKNRESVGTLARRHDCSIRTVHRVLLDFGLRNRVAPVVEASEPARPKPRPPELADPAHARTRLRRRLVQRANDGKLSAWRAAA